MAVLASPEHNALVIPYRKDVHNLLPTSKRFNHKGRDLLRVQYETDVVRLLKNLGINAPAPIIFKYKWPGPKPFESQLRTSELLTTSKRAYVLSSMGVGKTRAALYAFDFLRVLYRYGRTRYLKSSTICRQGCSMEPVPRDYRC
jgi:hypothetical protein